MFISNFDWFWFLVSGKNYYDQAFVEKDKYVAKEKKMPEFITEDI